MADVLNWITLQACNRIDATAITRAWHEELNETEEGNSVPWKLVAHPLLPEGKLALLFEHSVCTYETDKWGELVEVPICNYYRVLIYDAHSGELLSKYRFSLQGYAATVYLNGGILYAIVSHIGKENYTALPMWPHGKDDKQYKLGTKINSFIPYADGSLLVSYREGAAPIKRFSPKGKAAKVDLPEGVGIADLNVDKEGKIWAVAADRKQLVTVDKQGECAFRELPEADAHSVVVPEGTGPLLLVRHRHNGCFLDKIGSDLKEGTDKTGLCVLKTYEGDVQFFESVSTYGSLAALLFRGNIYIIDANNAEALPEKHSCPVCGEYEFADTDSREKCKVCGWIDDRMQELHPSWKRRLNLLSLEQAREYHQKGLHLKNYDEESSKEREANEKGNRWCPCCGRTEFAEQFEICRVCGWEDDLVQRDCIHENNCANGMSLHAARIAFREHRPVS